MSKGNVFLIVVGIASIISALVYYVLKTKKTGEMPIVGDGDWTPPKPGEFNPTAVGNFPLKYGSRGDAVKLLQAYMNAYFNGQLSVDGIWGAKTQIAYALMHHQVEFIASSEQITETEFNNYIQPHQHLLR